MSINDLATTLPDASVIKANEESLNSIVNRIDGHISGTTDFKVTQIFVERDYHAEGQPLKARIIVEVKTDE